MATEKNHFSFCYEKLICKKGEFLYLKHHLVVLQWNGSLLNYGKGQALEEYLQLIKVFLSIDFLYVMKNSEKNI